MASEIRVNKIENRSGLGTVTFADTGVDLAGIVTATTFSGSGASLTALPAAQLSGTLPAISAASLTNVPAANVVGVHTSLTVTNATTTGTAVVGGGVTISESGIEASGIGITCANINGTQIGGRRNIIINGAMNVAQRATSYTGADNYTTVDRFEVYHTGLNENVTTNQADVSSGTSPYTEGFRKSYKLTNGNQTDGAGASDQLFLRTRLEAKDLAASGWNYTSTSSFITLSFWVKTSVAQTYYMRVEAYDGTMQNFPFPITLSANTWTKIVKTIPGNSNVQFDFNESKGLGITWELFQGTNQTASSSTDNVWQAYSGSTRTKDQTSTFYTTNDATYEITGVQLEVGSQATAFEHRTFGEELSLCQRYFVNLSPRYMAGQYLISNEICSQFVTFPVRMRTTPTATHGALSYRENAGSFSNSTVSSNYTLTNKGINYVLNASGASTSDSFVIYANNVDYDAEL